MNPSEPYPRLPRGRAGLRVVAVYEATKGIGAAALAIVLWALVHTHPAASMEHLFAHLHLRPDSHLRHAIGHAFALLAPQQIVWAAGLVLLYTAARVIEAYGLWRARAWAEWFGIVSGGLYIPFEIVEIARHPSPLTVCVLIANIAIVAYLAWIRWSSSRMDGGPAPAPA